MNEELLEYYAGDELAASVWEGKYAMNPPKSGSTGFQEGTPNDMHWRMAYELGKAENHFSNKISDEMSEFGRKISEFYGKTRRPSIKTEHYMTTTTVDPNRDMAFKIVPYLLRYKHIIPQGSIMSMLGNREKFGSLSNCFVIPSPVDSYGGIFKTDEQIAQLEKRRGGVGLNLNTLRPEGTKVSNAAGTSTGAHSFMDRFSSTTREVAQNGRRGALMLLMDCRHPDIFKFVTKKSDLTRVTGANISVMLTDEFMKAVEKDEDFFCRFPVSKNITVTEVDKQQDYGYMTTSYHAMDQPDTYSYMMKIKAKELYDEIVNMAWSNGEPGVAFIDRIHDYSPEGVYEQYKAVASNPCGEQWMQAYDACRLLALNLYNIVDEPFTEKARIDYEALYEMAYVQQRLADDIVELEIGHIEKIIEKIKRDGTPEATKAVELDLWQNILRVAKGTRRTGCGFTALADMLAALGLKYDSDESLKVIKEVMKTKMRAELDCTIDLAIQRGPFEGWNANKEFETLGATMGTITYPTWPYKGANSFYQMLCDEFPEQVKRMIKHGRRNLSWSTVAPTGTVSIVALLNKYPNTSAGVEPQFSCYYMRNRKINPSDKNLRVDFVDENGDSWMTYPVVMGGLKEWIDKNEQKVAMIGINNLPKEVVEEMFKKSPYYNSCANDIDWRKRIEIQSIVQMYTTNAISSTLNLPKDVKKDVVNDIYQLAWKSGLKGVTIYRDGCRTGVLNTEKKDTFAYNDATKRPKDLEGELSIVTVKGVKYAVVVGILDGKPYEVFATEADTHMKNIGNLKGKITKVRKGHYNFTNGDKNHLIKDLQFFAGKGEQTMLTRLVSGMLRHGAKPEFVMQQIEKCELEVVSFGKAISRVLSKFVEEKELKEACPECGGVLVKQEGCTKCTCGYSKC